MVVEIVLIVGAVAMYSLPFIAISNMDHTAIGQTL